MNIYIRDISRITKAAMLLRYLPGGGGGGTYVSDVGRRGF